MKGRFTVEFSRGWVEVVGGGTGLATFGVECCKGAEPSPLRVGCFVGGGRMGPSSDGAWVLLVSCFWIRTDDSPSLAFVELIQTATEQQAPSVDNLASVFQR